jgi:hypothetical protein
VVSVGELDVSRLDVGDPVAEPDLVVADRDEPDVSKRDVP